MLTMMAGFAQFERDLTAERTKAALAHKRNAGAAYSPTPFGKVREGDALRNDAGEQSIIARIRAMRDRGLPLRRILFLLVLIARSKGAVEAVDFVVLGTDECRERL